MKTFSFHRVQDILLDASSSSRCLGIDVGKKTLGLALSDVCKKIASPMQCIERKNICEDRQKIKKIIYLYEIAGIIVGWPLHMNGQAGSSCHRVLSFCQNICDLNVSIARFDERLSTVASERIMRTCKMSRKKITKKINQAAAAYILQNAIDFANALPSREKS